MKTFVSVVKAGSFVGGARNLGLSPSLVSRHISDLEHQLGTQLVNRTARTFTLTPTGRHYLKFSERIIRLIEEEDEALVSLRDEAVGSLSVICPKWIALLDVGDALTAFMKANPLISLHFELGGLTDRIFHFVESSFDVAFQTKPMSHGVVQLKKVADLAFVICAAPSYLESRDVPDDPAALMRSELLVSTHELSWAISSDGNPRHWKLQNSIFQSNSYTAIQKAAVAGLGVALLPVRSALEDVRAGRLQVLLPDYEIPERPLYAVYAPGHENMRKIGMLLDFVEDWFVSHPMPSVSALAPVPAAAPELQAAAPELG